MIVGTRGARWHKLATELGSVPQFEPTLALNGNPLEAFGHPWSPKAGRQAAKGMSKWCLRMLSNELQKKVAS